MTRSVEVPRPSPTYGACIAIAGCSIEIDFKNGTAHQQAEALAYFNRLVEWCELPGVTIPYRGKPAYVRVPR